MQLYLLSATKSTGENVSDNLSDMSVFAKVTGFISGLKLLNYWFSALLQYFIKNVSTLPFLKSFPKFVLLMFLISLQQIFLDICRQYNRSQTQVENALAFQVCCLTKDWHYRQTQQRENNPNYPHKFLLQLDKTFKSEFSIENVFSAKVKI